MYRAVLAAACVASASAFAPMTALPRATARGELCAVCVSVSTAFAVCSAQHLSRRESGATGRGLRGWAAGGGAPGSCDHTVCRNWKQVALWWVQAMERRHCTIIYPGCAWWGEADVTNRGAAGNAAVLDLQRLWCAPNRCWDGSDSTEKRVD